MLAKAEQAEIMYWLVAQSVQGEQVPSDMRKLFARQLHVMPSLDTTEFVGQVTQTAFDDGVQGVLAYALGPQLQAEHAVAPGVALKVFPGHAVQGKLPEAENVPGAQGTGTMVTATTMLAVKTTPGSAATVWEATTTTDTGVVGGAMVL